MFAIRILLITIYLINCQWFQLIESAPTTNHPLKQVIPKLPGYLPVFIREGDTPLEDINDELAAAFNSYDHLHKPYLHMLMHKYVEKEMKKRKQSMDDEIDDINNSLLVEKDKKEKVKVVLKKTGPLKHYDNNQQGGIIHVVINQQAALTDQQHNNSNNIQRIPHIRRI